ncbi:MAG TPA: 23S rRNA (uracil(1939)-C(5))-methyltransferase RlmD [Candidatus Atribacteria bacterium]|nr:23S rRNA (uracil(1939)-C(5))-methyltransferase RlmD [Candidatus Atribacteria bacterium]
MDKGQIIEGKVVDFALPEGQGVLKEGGWVIFVPGVLIDEVCRVKITKLKRNYALGEAIEILEPSPSRMEPLCPHFGEGCGGCRFQFMAYEEQIKVKERNARQTLEKVGGISWEEVDYEGFTPSLSPWEYRNKMEFNFGEKEGELVLGLRPRGRYWDLIDLKTCYLMKKDLTQALLQLFRDYGKSSSLSGYDPRKKEGVLRNLLVRYSSSQELLVGLSTTGIDLPREEDLVGELRKNFPFLEGLIHIINNSPASALIFEDKRILWGKDHFFERVGTINYKVSLESFFQVNRFLSLALYEKAARYASLNGGETVLDLYCGSGGVGLFVADSAQQVVGVEENPQAVEDAKFNAWLNGRSNFTCVPGRVDKVLPLFSNVGVDVVIIDPPRAGLDKKVVRRVSSLSPQRLVYISCNISTLARDLLLFKEQGYHLGKISFLDLFPQTPYFESVALLKKG